MPSYDLTPRKVPEVRTKYRRIVTEMPVPESVPIIERLRQHEPLSMSGQPLVVWDRAMPRERAGTYRTHCGRHTLKGRASSTWPLWATT